MVILVNILPFWSVHFTSPPYIFWWFILDLGWIQPGHGEGCRQGVQGNMARCYSKNTGGGRCRTKCQYCGPLLRRVLQGYITNLPPYISFQQVLLGFYPSDSKSILATLAIFYLLPDARVKADHNRIIVFVQVCWLVKQVFHAVDDGVFHSYHTGKCQPPNGGTRASLSRAGFTCPWIYTSTQGYLPCV